MQVRAIDFEGDDDSYLIHLIRLDSGCESVSQCIDYFEGRLLEKQTGSQPLEFNIWNAESDYVSKSAGRKKHRHKLNPRVDSFLSNLPQNEEAWLDFRTNSTIGTSKGLLFTFDFLFTGQIGGEALLTERTETESSADAIQALLYRLAERSGNAIIEGKGHLKCATFLSVVFVCICIVAVGEGHPRHEAYAALRRYLTVVNGKNYICDDKKLGDYINGVRWLLQEQQRQFRRGLSYRAFELFFLTGRELTFYTLCPKEADSNKVFTNRIPLLSAPEESHAALPLWAPFVVRRILGGICSYPKICSYLGVTILSKEEDFCRFEANYKSKTLEPCQLNIGIVEEGDNTARKRRRVRGPKATQRRSGNSGLLTAPPSSIVIASTGSSSEGSASRHVSPSQHPTEDAHSLPAIPEQPSTPVDQLEQHMSTNSEQSRLHELGPPDFRAHSHDPEIIQEPSTGIDGEGHGAANIGRSITPNAGVFGFGLNRDTPYLAATPQASLSAREAPFTDLGAPMSSPIENSGHLFSFVSDDFEGIDFDFFPPLS